METTKEISLKDGITQKQEAPHTGNNRSRRTQWHPYIPQAFYRLEEIALSIFNKEENNEKK